LGGAIMASCSVRFTASRNESSSNSSTRVLPLWPSRTDEIDIDCSTVKPEVVTSFSAKRMNAFSELFTLMSHSGKVENERAFSVILWACSLVSMDSSSWDRPGGSQEACPTFSQFESHSPVGSALANSRG
jgi:hypothetical protein